MKSLSSIFGKMLLMLCLFWTTQASTQEICEDLYTPNQEECYLGTVCLNCDGSFTFEGNGGAASHIAVGFFDDNDDYQFLQQCNSWDAYFPPDLPGEVFCDQVTFSFPPGTVNANNSTTIQFQYYDIDGTNIGCNGQDSEIFPFDLSEFYAKNCKLVIELDHTNVLCQSPNGSVTVVGHPLFDHSYVWERDGVIVGNTASIDCLPAGTYCVTVTDDATGCTATDCVTVVEVVSTIINQTGGDTGISVGGIKLAAGQALTWWFAPLRIPDEMVLEWAPTPAFNNVTTLLNTGPVTSFGTICSPNPDCNSLLHIFDFAPGAPLPEGGINGNGIDILTGDAEAHPNNDNSICESQSRRIQGCLKVPEDGWVRLIVNPNACGTTGTGWTVRITCGCELKLQDDKDDEKLLLRSLAEEEEPYFNVKESIEEVNWIYPNPSNGLMYFNSESKINSVQVYDATGRLITKQSGLIESLDLTNENPGIYLVKMKGEFGDKVQKIIIQN